MERISDIQASIRIKRAACAEAERNYYQALHRLSLSRRDSLPDEAGPVPAEEEIDQLRQARELARMDVQAELARLSQAGLPQELIAQLPAQTPFLLFPVRLEARYITFKHVLYPMPPEHIIDIGAGSNGTAEPDRFQTDEDGILTYRMARLEDVNKRYIQLEVEKGGRKPPSGLFIRRRPDRKELCIRIYPDDISLDTHEPQLLPAEWDMGKSFWQNIWQGADPETAWTELSKMATPPRAAWIIRSTRPDNYNPNGTQTGSPEFPPAMLKDGVYTLPPVARLLPDRFVVRLYKNGRFNEFVGKPRTEPLLVGLDPTDAPFDEAGQTPGSGFMAEGAGLQAPEYLRWMFDLEAAENAGMAIRIDLSRYPEYETGVDKIIVLGAGLDADAAEGERLLNAHLENQLYTGSGLGILPQGTPTNNAGGKRSAFNQAEKEAGAYFRSQWMASAQSPVASDEEVLFRLLGIQPHFHLPNGSSADMHEASLMNRLLWPATWGYYLLQFFTPQLSESRRETLRRFFVDHVSGRGIFPTLRVNNQPYGIIPVTSFQHLAYSGTSEEERFLAGLWTQFLSPLDALWQAMAAKILSVSNKDVSGQRLDESFLRMLGQGASSVRWSRQWLAGQGVQEMMKTFNLNTNTNLRLNGDDRFNPAVRRTELRTARLNEQLFNAITNSYPSDPQRLQDVLLDSLAASEDRPLERIAGKKWNYLEWLAQSSLMDIWNDVFSGAPDGDGHPKSQAAGSLFARFTRQAALRTYLETGLRIAEPNAALWLLKAKDFELDHLNGAVIKINNPGSLGTQKNKIHRQYKPIVDHFRLNTPFELEPDRRRYFAKSYPKTGSLTLAAWLDQAPSDPEVQPIRELKEALTYFSQVPTARLEHLFTEHLDLCSHRLDAWMTGLVGQRLNKQRESAPSGIYLGAFGYLLDLQPNPRRAVVVVNTEPELIPAVKENVSQAVIPVLSFKSALAQGIDPAADAGRIFFYLGEESNPGLRLQAGLKRVEAVPTHNDAGSAGFLHLPSLAHASAAAILRAGYLGHKADNTAQTMAVDLKAPRVREAMKLIEGMQQGASLPELLGYHFERQLHERGLDRFLLELRRKYPLQRTSKDEAASALTTTDGLKLLDAWRAGPNKWLNGVPDAAPAALNALARELDQHFDALGDLLLSESVFQSVKGNPDRAAAALRTLNSGGQAVTPEFVHPQAPGRTITHRVGLVFEPASEGAERIWSAAGSPRSRLSPALNQWLSNQLPAPARVKMRAVAGDGAGYILDLSDLDIEPLDLLYACPETFGNADNSPLAFLAREAACRRYSIPLEDMRIDLESRTDLGDDDFSVFEISSLLASLRRIVRESRSLSSRDFHLPDASSAATGEAMDTAGLSESVRQLLEAQGPLAGAIALLRVRAADLQADIARGEPEDGIRSKAGELASALRLAWLLGQEDAAILNQGADQKETAALLAEKAERVAGDLETRLDKMRVIQKEMSSGSQTGALFQSLQDICEALFGKQLRVLPGIRPGNAQAVQTALEGRTWLENTSPDTLDEWVREASLVRHPLQSFRQVALLREVFQSADSGKAPVVLQLPFHPGRPQPWIGGPLSGSEESTPLEEQASLSLFLELPDQYRFDGPLTGLILDEWPEMIPFRQIDTGLTFQYNQPNTEAPQAMLLAVSPVEGGNWTWEHLLGAVLDALELSKKRLVSPAEIAAQNAGLGHVLPAIAMPFMRENRNVPVASLPN